MAIPGANGKTINDLVPEVINALQQRTDVSDIVPLYIKRALQEVTESYPFEELRVNGPVVSLTTNLPIYPVSFFLNAGEDCTFVESFGLYVDYPNNTVVSPLKYRTPAAIEMMIAPATVGVPSRWTRFGINIHIGPNPNAPYSIFMRYQRRHPFPSQTDATSLGSAAIYVPPTWEEIVIYAAAERIATVKRWNDQAKTMHDLLYGDPEFQMSDGKRGRPGLIAARVFQQERDEKFSSRQFTPIVARYNQR